MNGNRDMSLRVHFIEQVSPEVEICTRCAVLQRDVVIPAREHHLAMMEDLAEMDDAPRVTLCATCALFVRDALTEEHRCAE